MNGPEYRATEEELRAIELEFESRDLVLQPTLELYAGRVNNNRELLASLNRTPQYNLFTAKFAKPFSTGTTLEFAPSLQDSVMPSLTPNERSTAEWQVSISQSLWQDFFGRSTRLRRAREDFERKKQLAETLRSRGQMLFEFESLYWDWALALRQAELQDKNLKRSREILRWVRDRLRRSAAEATDLLQAQAATTQRELNLAALRQNLTQVWARIERYVPGFNGQPDPKDLSSIRLLPSLVAEWKAEQLPEPAPFDYLRAENEALAADERVREEREAIRPVLNLELAYGKNAIDPDSGSALSQSTNHTHEFSTIGLVFKSGLDIGLERKRVEAARATRNAARSRLESRRAEREIAWKQLEKEIVDLKDRITRAQELVDLQVRKANAERERYRKGRSTAFQALTFEQEAIEAEITLWTLYALMRKTEARARLFAR